MNEGKKYDGGKAPWRLLPWTAVREVLRVLEFGAKKYAPNSWQKLPDAEGRYGDAMIRHYVARFVDGETYDLESGLLHTAHMACNALFLIYFDLIEITRQQTEQLARMTSMQWPTEPGYDNAPEYPVEVTWDDPTPTKRNAEFPAAGNIEAALKQMAELRYPGETRTTVVDHVRALEKAEKKS